MKLGWSLGPSFSRAQEVKENTSSSIAADGGKGGPVAGADQENGMVKGRVVGMKRPFGVASQTEQPAAQENASHGPPLKRTRALVRSNSTPSPQSSAAAGGGSLASRLLGRTLDAGLRTLDKNDTNKGVIVPRSFTMFGASKAAADEVKGRDAAAVPPVKSCDDLAIGSLLAANVSSFILDVPLSPTSSPTSEGYEFGRVLPTDHSLKTGVCFEACRPFDWCRAVPAVVEARGLLRHMRQAVRCGPGSCADGGLLEDEGGISGRSISSRGEALERWVASSYYHAFPTDKLPTDHHLPFQTLRRKKLGLFVREPGEDNLDLAAALTRRLRQWEEAFRSLYTAFLHGMCPCFYYQAPDFSVRFMRQRSASKDDEDGGSSDDEDPVTAGGTLKTVVSVSQRWLRVKLRAAGVEYSTPCAPEAEQEDQVTIDPAAEFREELDTLTAPGAFGHGVVEKRQERKGRQATDIPRHKSVVVVKGAEAVHALFAFLCDMDNALPKEKVADVPRLVAEQPFVHAGLMRVKVISNNKVRRLRSVDPMQTEALETVYHLRLRGTLLPSQQRRMLEAVQYLTAEADSECAGGDVGSGGSGDWKVITDVAAGTEGFNIAEVGGEGQGDDDKVVTIKEARWISEKNMYTTISLGAPTARGLGR